MSLDAGVMTYPVRTPSLLLPPGPDLPVRLPLTAFDWYNSAFLCSFLIFLVSVQCPITF